MIDIDLKKLFAEKDTKAFSLLFAAIILGIYAKLTGNTRPLAGLVLVIAAAFILGAINGVLGKIKD